MRLPVTVLDRWLPALGALAFRLIGPTLRHRIENLEVVEAVMATGRPVVLGGFHGRLLLGIFPFRRFEPVIAISRSRDGERIASVVERLGWRTVRGSSSRGGIQALLRLVREIKHGGIAGHVLDGPRGPAGQIKPGVMLLAQRAGAPLFPVYLTARPAIVVPSWDRMRLPLPFSRVWIRIDEPIEVPADLDAEEIESRRLALEKHMALEQARLDAEI